MPYLVIALMLIGPWAQAAEPMTAEDAANRFCEAYNGGVTRQPGKQASYCEHEYPLYGPPAVSLYFPPARGYTMGHVLHTLEGIIMCDLLFEGFAAFNPPIGQEIETLRNDGWVLRLYAVQSGVSRLGNTCAL